MRETNVASDYVKRVVESAYIESLQNEILQVARENAALKERSEKAACSLETRDLVQIEGADKQEDGYQEKLSKLQKKVADFEAYLEEKDKTILEQENQLSELQDQVHELIKNEDKLQTLLKDKTHKVEELVKETKTTKERCLEQLQEI